MRPPKPGGSDDGSVDSDGLRPFAAARMASRRARRAELQQLSAAEGSWSVYRTLCQFRLGYLAFLVLLCILVFSFTLLMELFFAIFLPSARADPLFTLRAIVLLAALPFALILLSYCFEEAARLFRDAVDKSEGGLANFRLSLAVCIHFLRHHREMPDDRVHRELFDLYRREDEDAAAWQRVVTGIMDLPQRVLAAVHTDDPFDDANKETEDAQREELELAFDLQQHEEQLRLSYIDDADDVEYTESAADRWKKAVSAAKSTVVFQQTHFDGPPLDFSTLVLVDVVCPLAFEAVTMWTFTVSLLTTLSPVHAFLDYIQSGFFTVATYLVIWMVCHFCSARNRKMREFVSNYRRRRRDMSRRLQDMENEARAEYLWLLELGFRPVEYFDSLFFSGVEWLFEVGEWIQTHLCCCIARRPDRTSECDEEQELLQVPDAQPSQGYATLTSVSPDVDPLSVAATNANQPQAAVQGKQHVREIENRLHRCDIWSKFSHTRRLWILCPLVLASAIISFAAFYVGWLLMGICLILLGNTIQAKFPQVRTRMSLSKAHECWVLF